MELLIGAIIIIGALVILDLAAMKWGDRTSQRTWMRGGYDPRDNWNSHSQD